MSALRGAPVSCAASYTRSGVHTCDPQWRGRVVRRVLLTVRRLVWGEHRPTLESSLFSAGGPHWEAHPLSARPHCQVTKPEPRDWGGARTLGGPSSLGWKIVWGPSRSLPGPPFLRGDVPAAGPGDPGRAGLVSGTAGDHADLPLCQRDGLTQGEGLRGG